jgi:hypothetical protein
MCEMRAGIFTEGKAGGEKAPEGFRAGELAGDVTQPSGRHPGSFQLLWGLRRLPPGEGDRRASAPAPLLPAPGWE